MHYQSSLLWNDFEQKINYDWPKGIKLNIFQCNSTFKELLFNLNMNKMSKAWTK